VIRTVSPTLALVGVMVSLGPLGAAERKVEDHVGQLEHLADLKLSGLV